MQPGVMLFPDEGCLSGTQVVSASKIRTGARTPAAERGRFHDADTNVEASGTMQCDLKRGNDT